MDNENTPSFKNVKTAFDVYCGIIKAYEKGISEINIPTQYIGRIILLSLTCEIGFKAMLLSENKSEKGHKLIELFDKLSPQKQEYIIRLTEHNSKSFREKLSKNGNHFVKWRYFYEGFADSVDYDFMCKLFCAIKTLLDINSMSHPIQEISTSPIP